MTAELIDRGLLGAGEVEALLRTALADAMFALVSGQVDSWAEAPAADCLLPLTPSARGGWLLNEATRRRQVLASFAEPSVSAQDRVAAAPGAAQATRVLGQGQTSSWPWPTGGAPPATWRSSSVAGCTRRCSSYPGCGRATWW